MRRSLYLLAGTILLSALPLFTVAFSDRPGRPITSLRPNTSRTVRVQGEHLITITQLEPTQQTVDWVKHTLRNHPAVLRFLRGTKNRLVSFELVDQDTKATRDVPPPDRYRAAFYDYTNNRAIIARGRFDHSDIEVFESAEQPDPSEEEFQEAVSILSKDPKLAAAFKNETVSAYQPMPPLIGAGAGGDRIIGVGLFSKDGSVPHEVVGVNLIRRRIVRFKTLAPETSRASPTHCGPPSAGQGSVPRGTAGQFLVQISREGTLIWQFTVVRPSASSGTRGSSIELRDVDYRGKRVLRRAHVPILNVQYERNSCGPFRDWSYQEDRLMADGTDVAPGIRVTSTPPKTIIDTNDDMGNFLGVAIYDNRSEVTLVTEKSAGWYRYLSEYTFQDNGVIRPRYAFGATASSCVCAPHVHHAYFRFDFDIGTPENNVVFEKAKRSMIQLTSEAMRSRLFGSEHLWVVQNSVTGETVTIRPGRRDGNWDKYGRGDIWALQFKPNELDDGVICITGCDTRIQIHNFINGESLSNQDVVIWYGVHSLHNENDTNTLSGPHVAGPDLILEKF
ncbi:MAG TPA: hypothetical protein VNO14_11455 [Blastocatellia bacterium]|nr:hypothetical protein [Blastocatellia bacterium]